jgi:hypothetical protein
MIYIPYAIHSVFFYLYGPKAMSMFCLHFPGVSSLSLPESPSGTVSRDYAQTQGTLTRDSQVQRQSREILLRLQGQSREILLRLQGQSHGFPYKLQRQFHNTVFCAYFRGQPLWISHRLHGQSHEIQISVRE